MGEKREDTDKACLNGDKRPSDIAFAACARDTERREPRASGRAYQHAKSDRGKPVRARHRTDLVSVLAWITVLVSIAAILHWVPTKAIGLVLVAPLLE